MARAILLLSRAAVLLAGLTVAQSAAAGGPGVREGERRPTNSFTLLTTPTPARASISGQSNGVGVGAGKPVVRNPYAVPLLQNAGTFGSAR